MNGQLADLSSHRSRAIRSESSLTIQTDEFGRVRGPGVHDAVIEEIHVRRGEVFSLRMKHPSGCDRWLHLTQVANFGFDRVCPGTIVSDLYCWPVAALPADNPSVEAAWRVLFASKCSEGALPGVIASTRERCQSFFLVWCESAFGGDIGVLCGDASMTPVEAGTKEPIGYALVWAAAVLRAIGHRRS